MANTTSTNELPIHEIVGAVGYILLGLPTCIGNMLVAISVLHYSALRNSKEHIIPMGLALADGINAFAYVSAGIYRLVIVIGGDAYALVSPQSCFVLPFVVTWLIAIPLSTLMLITVSFDRLLLVSLRERYIFNLGIKYAWTMVGACYATTICIACLAVGLALVYPIPNGVTSIMCYPSEAVVSTSSLSAPLIYWYQHGPTAFAFVSVALFVLVAPVYKCTHTSVTTAGSNVQLQMKRQRKMTKSLGLSSACTFFLQCIPNHLGYLLWYEFPGYPSISYLFFALTICNPMANIPIYQLRHAEMREAFVGLLKRKQLPDNIDLWPCNQPSRGATRRAASHAHHHNISVVEIK